jgi:HSP20 family protein
MANITRFDPFSQLADMDPFRGLEDILRAGRARPWTREPEVPQMKMDVSEDDKEYTVRAEIPGVKKDDLHIQIEGNQVVISAEVKREVEARQGEAMLHRERYTGKLYRSFALAQEIDESKAEARYNDGVLELHLPKRGNGASRELKVQ